jgi:hypothetical protein
VENAADLWGANDPDAIFDGHPVRMPPFPRAGRRKDRYDYDRELVRRELSKVGEPQLEELDPRTLSRTQPGLQRAALKFYFGDEYRLTGEPYADKTNIGNRYPLIYKRDDGTNMILSGHHRATAALLKGKLLRARVVEGPWPERSG